MQMRVEINKLHRRLGATMIFVTHDQVEAMTLADRIVVLRKGVIEQVGTPLELYNKPANIFVAGFIGSPRMNLLPGRIGRVDGHRAEVDLDHGQTLDSRLPRAAEARRDRSPSASAPSTSSPPRPATACSRGEVQLAEQLGGETYVYVDPARRPERHRRDQGPGRGQPRRRDGPRLRRRQFHVFGPDEKVMRHA